MNVYGAVNRAILERIPRGVRRVLDVGCGDGALAAALKARQASTVTGVTFSDEEATLAAPKVDAVERADLETADLTALGEFDCVIASHVLEHLRDPVSVLSRLQRNVSRDGTLLIALPNALHYRQRLEFLVGRFRYTDGGLMDRTHYRFFDWRSAQALVRDAGLELISAEADGGFPGSRFLGPARGPLDHLASSRLPGLLGVQFVMLARRSRR